MGRRHGFGATQRGSRGGSSAARHQPIEAPEGKAMCKCVKMNENKNSADHFSKGTEHLRYLRESCGELIEGLEGDEGIEKNGVGQD